MLEKPDQLQKFLSKNSGVKGSFLEYSTPVLIQSGEVFNMNKFSIQSDANKLTYDTIYLNVCVKYKDMNVMASRTLIVNP
jgi:nucleosome binding factor SPN SPT16 subunit